MAMTIQSSRRLAFVSLWIVLLSFVYRGEAFLSSPTGAWTKRTSSLRATTDPIVGVALTRELGKNDKLLKEIVQTNDLSDHVQTIELPCIAHAQGPDFDRLAETLRGESWDWVAVTSPEAARVLASVWDPAYTFSWRVCAVGKATEATLTQLGIDVNFCPSKATASTLVEELPGEAGCKVLYPASAKAATTLQDGLEARGFQVTRLDTYDTVPNVWRDAEKEASRSVRIACFGSPSAVQGWLQNTDNDKSVLAACIGETSAEECRAQGWTEDNIFYPEKPGMSGWATAIQDALNCLQMAQQSSA